MDRKYPIGYEFMTRDGLAVVIGSGGRSRKIIQFRNSGYVKDITTASFVHKDADGTIRIVDDSIHRLRIGDIISSKHYGDMVIIEGSKSNSIFATGEMIKVRFLNSGNEKLVSHDAILTGEVADNPLNHENVLEIGSKYNSKTCGSFEIVNAYRKSYTGKNGPYSRTVYDVKFLNNGAIRYEVERSKVLKGSVSDGITYLGGRKRKAAEERLIEESLKNK